MFITVNNFTQIVSSLHLHRKEATLEDGSPLWECQVTYSRQSRRQRTRKSLSSSCADCDRLCPIPYMRGSPASSVSVHLVQILRQED